MSESQTPLPIARLEFTTEPHPDPLVRALLELIDQLRRENQMLKERLQDGPYPR